MGNTCAVPCNFDIEYLQDIMFEHYQTIKACAHINRVLSRFNRQPHRKFHNAMKSMVNLGLHQPCADSVKYLQNMKHVSESYGMQ